MTGVVRTEIEDSNVDGEVRAERVRRARWGVGEEGGLGGGVSDRHSSHVCELVCRSGGLVG